MERDCVYDSRLSISPPLKRVEATPTDLKILNEGSWFTIDIFMKLFRV